MKYLIMNKKKKRSYISEKLSKNKLNHFLVMKIFSYQVIAIDFVVKNKKLCYDPSNPFREN